jgi:hypothetical protein
MLDPEWIDQNRHRFDVFHIHFGFDATTAEVLSDVTDRLRGHGKPLVYTVHDLRNPHHPEPAAHREQQDVLVPAADAIVTLTPGAANAIRSRWERAALVHPHPHVLDRKRIRMPRRDSDHFVVGVHVKSLRANMDPFPVLDTLADTVASLPATVLQINVHDEIFEPGNHWYAPDAGNALLGYRKRPNVDVRIHPYFTDDELWHYLSSLSASVLPYRFGTHSGWLEACFDLGTAVIAPSCGFYGEQRPCELFDYDETRFDAASLDHAVRTVHDRFMLGEAAPRASWPDRFAERAQLAQDHACLYETLLR